MKRLSPDEREQSRLHKLKYARDCYQQKRAGGICTRCLEPSLEGRTLCSAHRLQGNRNARLYARGRFGCVPHDPEHPQFGYFDRVQTGRQKRPDPASHFRRRYALPDQCPRCRSNVFKVLFDSEPGVRCPSCGYMADQYMLWNIDRAQRASRAV